MTATGPDGQHDRQEGYRLSFPGLVRSEWIKFWSVRAPVISLVVAALVAVGVSSLLAAVGAATAANGADAMDISGDGALAIAVVGPQVATLVAAALGVIVITGEYSTGTIRTFLTAAPRRLPVLWAKAVACALAVVVVLGPAVFGGFFIVQAILSSAGGGIPIGDANVLPILFGNVFVLAGTALAGLGLGTALRSAVGAICSLLGLMFVVPMIVLPLPDFPGKSGFLDYSLGSTTSALTTPVSEMAAGPSVAGGTIGFLAWIALFLACGALVLERRDA